MQDINFKLPKEIERLQKRLKSMPLVPLNPRLRKQRDKLQKKLYEEALKYKCLDKIDLLAGQWER